MILREKRLSQNAKKMDKPLSIMPIWLWSIGGLFFIGIIIAVIGFFSFGWFIPPVVMTLNGEPEVIVNYGSTYIDEHVTATQGGTDISDLVEVTSDLNTSILGSYVICYQYKNTSVLRNIEVVDTEPPKIALLGDASMMINLGETFMDPKCSVTDNCDVDIEKALVVDGYVDINVVGVYTLEYRVTDGNNNKASVTRTVEVVRDSPLTQDLQHFNLDGLFAGTILGETEKQGEDYISTTAFIGDSVDSIFLYSGAVPAEQVWHTVSITPKTALSWEVLNNGTHRKMLISDMIAEYQPERVILTMGVNNVGMIEPEVMADDYLKLIEVIRNQNPDVQIIIHNILPIKRFYDANDRPWYDPSNDEINKANYYIASMCAQNAVYYLDSAHVLKDDDGVADSELYDDGIHPSREGMRLVMDYILTHALIEE